MKFMTLGGAGVCESCGKQERTKKSKVTSSKNLVYASTLRPLFSDWLYLSEDKVGFNHHQRNCLLMPLSDKVTGLQVSSFIKRGFSNSGSRPRVYSREVLLMGTELPKLSK